MNESATTLPVSSNPNQALWEKGDFTQIAATMRQSGTELVESLGVRAGMDVLDVGSGDGTTALPAARLGARVLAVDISRNLVEAGRKRVEAEGLDNIRFEQGDVTHLDGIADASFDLVVSIFGAMFAPTPEKVARELVRVTRRSGRIVMGNWIPNDPSFASQLLRISSAYTPPPPEGFISPMLWGVERNVTERFGAAGIAPENIHFQRDTFTFRAPISPADFVDRFRYFYGPTMNAFDAAEKDGRAEALRNDLVELFTLVNKSGEPNAVVIPATFLRVTVTR